MTWDEEVASPETKFIIDLFDSTVNIKAKWAQSHAVTNTGQ